MGLRSDDDHGQYYQWDSEQIIQQGRDLQSAQRRIFDLEARISELEEIIVRAHEQGFRP